MGKVKEFKKSNNQSHTRPQPSKFKQKSSYKPGGGVGPRPPFKKPHGKPSFAKSKEAIKQERAQKFQQRQALREQKRKELGDQRAKAREEKEAKIRQYKKKRLEKTKVLSKRTQRGQPLMKDRMQLLLKQIQEMKKNS